ncbi:unnamed protein product, partial [Ectocarpus sp. 12 AP-2014]
PPSLPSLLSPASPPGPCGPRRPISPSPVGDRVVAALAGTPVPSRKEGEGPLRSAPPPARPLSPPSPQLFVAALPVAPVMAPSLAIETGGASRKLCPPLAVAAAAAPARRSRAESTFKPPPPPPPPVPPLPPPPIQTLLPSPLCGTR